MLLTCLQEPLQDFDGLFKLFGELLLFLIAPSLLQGIEPRMNRRDPTLHVEIELAKFGCKSPELRWINNCTRHIESLPLLP